MASTPLSGFPRCCDEHSLRATIHSICAEFGRVKSLKILPATRAPESGLHCVCFLQFDSPEAGVKLASKFDVVNFGTEIAFFADVDATWTGPKANRAPTGNSGTI